MQSRGRPNRVTKPTAPRRPNRRIDEDQLAAQFGAHGNTAEDDYRAAAAVASAVSGGQHDGGEVDEVMGDAEEVYKVDDEDDGDAEAEPDPDHAHAPNVDALEVHHGMPMAPMTPNQHQHHPSHTHHHQGIDDLAAPEILQGASGLTYAAAAAAVADLGPPPPPAPPVGSTMPAPQPLVAATDFQPNPPPPQPVAQPIQVPSVPPPPSHHQHHQPPPPPHHKTTEQLAHDSGYEGFKIDSAFAKRMSRDPGQRLAEQRRHGQDLNLVRRSNVEALFAQIAGTEAANPCAHCRKGQGPWTICVVYSGQMMGSCANCWFNASGSRCSFHGTSIAGESLYICIDTWLEMLTHNFPLLPRKVSTRSARVTPLRGHCPHRRRGVRERPTRRRPSRRQRLCHGDLARATPGRGAVERIGRSVFARRGREGDSAKRADAGAPGDAVPAGADPGRGGGEAVGPQDRRG